MEGVPCGRVAPDGSGARPARVLLVKGYFEDPDIRQICHPLGIMCVASVLREAGHEVRLLDMRVEGRSLERLEAEMRAFRPLVVGVSAQSSESRSMERIAACAKRTDPRVVVMAGGPHPTAYGREVALNPDVDYAVVGEGEAVAVELVGRLASGKDAGDVPGLVYRANGGIVETGRAAGHADIESLPMPAYDLLPMERYDAFDRFSRSGGGRCMSLFTSRACPYGCIYCHAVFGKTFRARSAKSVVQEMRHLNDRYGVTAFEIVDDAFNLDRRRVLDICGMISRSGLRPTLAFPNGMRADLLDEEQIAALGAAGTVYMAFAVECASQRLQKLIRKRNDLPRVQRAIEIARSHGIHTHGFFMIGLPGESLEEMEETVNFIVSSDLHTFNLFVATPYEGTELGEMSKRMGRGVVTDFSQDYYSKDFINLTDVPKERVNALRRRAMLRFYLDPARAYRILHDFPGDRSVTRMARIFLRRLSWKA